MSLSMSIITLQLERSGEKVNVKVDNLGLCCRQLKTATTRKWPTRYRVGQVPPITGGRGLPGFCRAKILKIARTKLKDYTAEMVAKEGYDVLGISTEEFQQGFAQFQGIDLEEALERDWAYIEFRMIKYSAAHARVALEMEPVEGEIGKQSVQGVLFS